jgi:hypothetical protein
MRQIHDKDEKLFAKETIDASGDFKLFAHQTYLIVKRHIGALHAVDWFISSSPRLGGGRS